MKQFASTLPQSSLQSQFPGADYCSPGERKKKKRACGGRETEFMCFALNRAAWPASLSSRRETPPPATHLTPNPAFQFLTFHPHCGSTSGGAGESEMQRIRISVTRLACVYLFKHGEGFRSAQTEASPQADVIKAVSPGEPSECVYICVCARSPSQLPVRKPIINKCSGGALWLSVGPSGRPTSEPPLGHI